MFGAAIGVATIGGAGALSGSSETESLASDDEALFGPPEIALTKVDITASYYEVCAGEFPTVFVGLKNNTQREKWVYLDYIPYLHRDPPGRYGSKTIEYENADLTPDDAILGTVVSVPGTESRVFGFEWAPHLALEADVGHYGIKLIAREEMNGNAYDVERKKLAFYINEVDDCTSPSGTPEVTHFLVDRE